MRILGDVNGNTNSGPQDLSGSRAAAKDGNYKEEESSQSAGQRAGDKRWTRRRASHTDQFRRATT